MEDLSNKWLKEVDNKPESVENLITTMKNFVQNCCSDGFKISRRMFKEVFPKIIEKNPGATKSILELCKDIQKNPLVRNELDCCKFLTDLCCEHPQYFDDVVKLIGDDKGVLFPFLRDMSENGKFCEKVLEIYETKVKMEPDIKEGKCQYMTLMNIATERSDLLDRCCNVYGKMLNGADYGFQLSEGHEVLLSYMEAKPEVVEQMSENVLGIIKSEIKPEAKDKFLESENALKLLLCIAPHIAAEEFNNVIEEGYDIKSAKLNDQDVSKLLGALRSDIVPYEEKEKLIEAVKSISGARNAFDCVSAMQDICDKIRFCFFPSEYLPIG